MNARPAAVAANASVHATVEAAAIEAQHRTVTRADGGIERMSVERVLTQRYLVGRADALGIDITKPAGKSWLFECSRIIMRAGSGRADGAYYDGALRTMYSGSILMAPTQDRADILSGLPVRQVAVGAKTYMLRSAETSGKATPYNANKTSYNRPSHNVDESEGALRYYCFEIPDHWLTAMYESFAASDRARMDQMALRKAFAEAEFDTRMSTTGGALASLHTLGIPRQTSSASYVSGTAIATLYADFMGMVQSGRLDNPTGGTYDTLIVTDRVWANLSLSTNLGAGGDSDARTKIVQGLQTEGISRIIVGKSLRDWGTDVDAAVLFQSSDEFGLKQVRQMNLAPVQTYADANGNNTVFAASWGGIECPKPETALILELPVV